MENRITIDDNYIKEVREESPTDLFHSHLLQRDDDPNEELEEEIALMRKCQPAAYDETMDIIQNFILDAFDSNGRLFEETNCQSGTTINTVYGKLREVAYKHLLRVSKAYDSKTRAITKMLFISRVDGEIFENVRQEAVFYYKKQIGEGKIPLPDEIKHFHSLINKYGIRDKLYQCIAEWYVEAEVSVDIVRRIQMYGILEGHREKQLSSKLRKAWELRSNYYIDLEAAFLSMICYLGTKLLAQFNSGFFEFSKVTIMMKVIYFIIFRSAISTPIIAAAIFSTLGTVFISLGLQLLFSKLADFKKMREVELAFRDFKVITSNLTWDNQLLQKLLLDSCFYKELEMNTQYESTTAAIEAKLHEMLEGSQKYRDGTVIKQFNSEDQKLKSLVIKDVEDEGMEDWIEVSVDGEKSHEFLPPPEI